MANPFVWFDLRTKDAAKSRSFYEQLFGWDVAEVPVGGGKVTMVGGIALQRSIHAEKTPGQAPGFKDEPGRVSARCLSRLASAPGVRAGHRALTRPGSPRPP